MSLLDDKIALFIPAAETKARQMTVALRGEFDYYGYQSTQSEDLILKISEVNDFIALLRSGEGNYGGLVGLYGGLTTREVSDLIDFFNKWLELNKVIAATYSHYTMEVVGNVVVAPGLYALATDLSAEIVARQSADQALLARIIALEDASGDAEFPDGFFDNLNGTYAVVFDDDSRLHTHANKVILDQINDTDLTNIKALAAHYQSYGDPGGQHVSPEDRARWDASEGGSGTSAIKYQKFTSDGSTDSFTVTVGNVDQVIGVYINGILQAPGTNYNMVGNAIQFGTDVPTGYRVEIAFVEGITVGESANVIYDRSSPSTLTVGGMPAGTSLSGRNILDIIEEIVCDYLAPNFTSFTINSQAALIEVGTALSGNKTFQWNTTNPANVTSVVIEDFTAGVDLTGALANDGSEVVDIGTIDNSIPIDQIWRIKGTNTEGDPMTPMQRSVKSIYPYFFGKVSSGGMGPGLGRPTANQALIDSGTTVLAVSTGQINVTFGSSSDDYIWFAIPASSALKMKWFVDELNNGNIGGVVNPGGNLFPDPDLVPITKAGFWSTINYRIYISNYQTASAVLMQLRNS